MRYEKTLWIDLGLETISGFQAAVFPQTDIEINLPKLRLIGGGGCEVAVCHVKSI